MKYDIAIIGGGPAGYTAAERASENGLKVILFEKNALGGVCLNEGCIPTKTLLYSAKMLDNIKAVSKYGITNEAMPIADLPKIISRKKKVVRKLVAGIKMKLNNDNTTLIEGEAKLSKQEGDTIYISCNDEIYSASKVLVCTGSGTIIPPIEGLSDTPFWTSKEALDATELPASIAIIGGGVIGMEFASFFNSLGVEVNVIEMLPEILGAMDKETSEMLRNEYTKRGVKFHLETKVVKVAKNEVFIEKNGEISTIKAEKILLSVGRKPSAENLGLESFHLEFRGRGLKVNESMQTSNPSIYAAGDVTGFSLLAHTAIREAEVAVNHILGIDDAMSYSAIPGVVYTNPEIVGVGRTEEDLIAKGEEYQAHKLPLSYSGRFVAENELSNGLCKLITNKDNQIIGCHILGNPASELIAIAGIAINRQYTIKEFKKEVFPHPSVGEILHEILY